MLRLRFSKPETKKYWSLKIELTAVVSSAVVGGYNGTPVWLPVAVELTFCAQGYHHVYVEL